MEAAVKLKLVTARNTHRSNSLPRVCSLGSDWGAPKQVLTWESPQSGGSFSGGGGSFSGGGGDCAVGSTVSFSPSHSPREGAGAGGGVAAGADATSPLGGLEGRGGGGGAILLGTGLGLLAGGAGLLSLGLSSGDTRLLARTWT